ncbi:hypothetical protein AKJ16_DCAP12035 [Drosera capensis]
MSFFHIRSDLAFILDIARKSELQPFIRLPIQNHVYLVYSCLILLMIMGILPAFFGDKDKRIAEHVLYICLGENFGPRLVYLSCLRFFDGALSDVYRWITLRSTSLWYVRLKSMLSCVMRPQPFLREARCIVDRVKHTMHFSEREIVKTRSCAMKFCYDAASTCHGICNQVSNYLQSNYGVDISYKKSWRVLPKAKTIIGGGCNDSFAKLMLYVEGLTRINPRSRIIVDVDDNIYRFFRHFVSLNASIIGFNHCILLLFLNGTFLKGNFNGVILEATEKDARLVVQIRVKLIEWFNNHRKKAEEWNGVLCPKMLDALNDYSRIVVLMVSKDHRSCFLSMIDPYFFVESYKKSYEGVIYHVP